MQRPKVKDKSGRCVRCVLRSLRCVC